YGWLHKFGDLLPGFVVIGRVLYPRLSNEIKLRKQTVRNDGLDRIEPAVDSEKLYFIAVDHPMIAVEPKFSRQFIGSRGNDAAISPYVKVFERVKAVGGRFPPRTHRLPVQFPAD